MSRRGRAFIVLLLLSLAAWAGVIAAAVDIHDHLTR